MVGNKRTLLEYLSARGVKDQLYYDILEKTPLECEYHLCSAGGYDFMFSHFLDGSDKPGFGLIVSNKNLHADKGSQVAIGLVEGDDVICIDTTDGSVNLWLVENGNGEHIPVASNFRSFWRMITADDQVKV